MPEPMLTKTERRRLVKRRARVISGHMYLPLLLVLVFYLWPMQLVYSLLGSLEYAGLQVEIAGVTIPVVREVLILLVNFLEAPLVLGAYEYMLALDAEHPLPVTAVFGWFSSGARLYAAAKFAAFQVCLDLLLFGLDRLPLMVLGAPSEEYLKAAQAVLTAAQSGTVETSAIAQLYAGNAVRALCFCAVLLGLIIKFAFAPLPYLCAMDGEGKGGFFAKLGMSFRCIRGHLWEYVLLQITLIGWYFLASLVGNYLSVILYPYLMMTQTVFIHRLIRESFFRPEPGGENGPAPENTGGDPDGRPPEER